MEEAMLKEAIAASLRESNNNQESSSKPRSRHVVDLTNESDHESDLKGPKSKSVIGPDTDDEAEQGTDDDDEDLRRAIAMSLAGGQHDSEPSEDTAEAAPPPNQQTLHPLGVLGLNRKQMEEERLARLAKRKAESPASSPRQSPMKILKTNSASRVPQKISMPDSSQQKPQAEGSKPPVQPTARPEPQWLHGAVKKTHTPKCPRKGNEITIEEVLQRGDLELAVLSSFLWDMEWLFTKLDTRRTRILLVMNAKEESTVSKRQETFYTKKLD